MSDLFTNLSANLHRLTLFGILVSLAVVFWGFRPAPRAPRAERVDKPPPIALVVDTGPRRASLYRGNELLGVFPCGIAGGRVPRLPVGRFTIHHQRPDDAHGRAFALAYPGPDLARKAHAEGWIDQGELTRILDAHRFGLLPPQNTRLGPAPLIVGGGRDRAPRGAIALDDEDLERLAPFLGPGTIVVLRPGG